MDDKGNKDEPIGHAGSGTMTTMDKANKNDTDMKTEDWLATWFASVKLPQYLDAFVREHFDVRAAVEQLDEKDLEGMGITGGHKKALLAAAQQLKAEKKGKDKDDEKDTDSTRFEAVIPAPLPQVSAYLADYFKGYDSVIKLMNEFSGLELPTPQLSGRYQHSCKYLRDDLPSVVGNVNQLDLRLLSGCLDQPDKKMPVVELVLSALEGQDKSGFADINVLLAGHAMGKTKAVFDIALERYTILIDASGDAQGQNDIVELFRAVGETCANRARYKTQFNFEQEVKKYFLAVFGARLIMLQLYLAVDAHTKSGFSPEKWRNLQLNGLVSEKYSSILLPIYTRLLKYEYASLSKAVQSLLDAHKGKTSRRIVGAFDEANVWLEMHKMFSPLPKDTTTSSGTNAPPDTATSSCASAAATTPAETSPTWKAPKGTNDRPVWYAIGGTFSDMGSLAMLVAGTRIRLRDKRVLFSSAGKVGAAAGRKVVLRIEFSGCDYTDVIKLSARLFTDHFTVAMREMLAKALCGSYKTRPRFITTYAFFLEKKGEPMVYLIEFVEQLTGTKEDWALGFQIAKLMKQFPTISDGHQELRKLLTAYVCHDGELVESSKDKIDWLSCGICLVEGTEEKVRYRLMENLVAEAIDKYLVMDEAAIIPPLVAHLLATKPDDATCGSIFDEVIAIGLREAVKAGRKPTFWQCIPWAKEYDFSVRDKIGYRARMVDFIQNTGELGINLGEKKARIDVMVRCPNVHVFFGNKVTFQQTKANNRRSVDAREVRKNHRSTKLQNIYTVENNEETTIDPQNKLPRNNVLQWYYNNHLEGIIRVHICLPYAPKQVSKGMSHDFSPGEIRLSYTTIEYDEKGEMLPACINEARIDIDSSCLELLGIFTDNDLKCLMDAFPLKKGNTKKTDWLVVESTDKMLASEVPIERARAYEEQISLKRLRADDEFGVTYAYCKSCTNATPMSHLRGNACLSCQ